jgi:hypothetical protein
MNSILSYALTFVGGVLAKWAQGLLQDRKKEWNDLTGWSFCTRATERVYITAVGREICFGTTGLQAPSEARTRNPRIGLRGERFAALRTVRHLWFEGLQRSADRLWL